MSRAQQIRAELDRLHEYTKWYMSLDRSVVITGEEGNELGAVCTETAVLLAEEFGGKVMGYEINENPSAVIGRDQFGHDFTVIDDRWLADFWASHEGHRDLYDLENAKDMEEVLRLYGDPATWREMGKGGWKIWLNNTRTLSYRDPVTKEKIAVPYEVKRF